MNSSEHPNKLARQAPGSTGAGGDALSVQHYLSLVLHRKWIVVAVFVAVAVTTAAIAHFLPDRFTSETLILVDPQQVPDAYVVPTVSGDIHNRLGTLSQQILSSTRLQKIIDTFKLYPEDRKTMPREDVIAEMRKDIEVKIASSFGGGGGKQDLQAFTISYTGGDARIVAQVANELASLFIEENLKAREEEVTGTSDFMGTELQESRKKLEDLEAKIRDFKMKHLGEMPEQEQSNIQILSQLQARLQLLSDALNRAEQQRSYMQTLESEPPPPVAANGAAQNAAHSKVPTAPGPVRGPEKSLAEIKLEEMQTRYGDNHPDVKMLKVVVEKERHEREEADKKAEANQPASPAEDESADVADVAEVAPPAGSPSAPAFRIRAQLSLIEAEINKDKQEQQRLVAEIASVQQKLEAVPVREQEIADVVRDYSISKDHYSKLLEKDMSAEMATQLELRQKGEKFTILDPAQPAQKPSSPNRPAIDGAGAMGGLGLGIALALLSEFVSGTVTSAAQLSGALGLAVLGVIPMISTPYDLRRRKRWILATASGGLATMLITGAYLLFHYRDQLF